MVATAFAPDRDNKGYGIAVPSQTLMMKFFNYDLQLLILFI